MKRDERDRRSRPGGGERWALALASVASLMIALDLLVVSAALTTIRGDLGASVEDLQWTVTGYSVSFAALLMTGAALGDRVGRRRMFAGGLALFVAASAACALAGSVGVLIAARVVQGAGAALVIPVALALVSAAYPPEVRGKAIGTLEGITGLATISGPVLGGAIAGGVAWEWIFWINVPIGLVTASLAVTKVQESFGHDRDFGIEEWSGMTVFLREGDRVFKTYFTTGRGTETLGTVWGLLDLTPLGRQEEWEDSPDGHPQGPPYEWWRRHDEYGAAPGVGDSELGNDARAKAGGPPVP